MLTALGSSATHKAWLGRVSWSQNLPETSLAQQLPSPSHCSNKMWRAAPAAEPKATSGKDLSPCGGFGAERPFLRNSPWLSWSNCGQGPSCAHHSAGTDGTVSVDVQLNFILLFSLLPLIPGHLVIILIRLKPMWEQNEPWHLCNSNSWAHPAAAREGNPQQLAPELNQAPCHAKKCCAMPRNAVPCCTVLYH